MKYAFPKPTVGHPGVWVEISIAGGNADTKVYIDEFNPISDQANIPGNNTSYLGGDVNRDAIVNGQDLLIQASTWLDTGSVTGPRDGGMLVNGVFYSDFSLFSPSDNNAWLSVAPAGWVFTGAGDSGIQKIGTRGVVNYSGLAVEAMPLGGDVAAYIIDDAVLEQVVAETLAAGQTYYAMAYVMAKNWNSWKDDVIMSLEVGGIEVASFTRPLSRQTWRPVYGAYTATAADAGKQMTIKIAYENSHVAESANSEFMFIGYVYLGNSMPDEWPEGRDSVLVNGGFEDLTGLP